MELRQESGVMELSELITIWANAWAKEKGARGILWVEHTKAAVDARLKWKLNSHTKTLPYGLTLNVSAIPAVSEPLVTTAEITAPAKDSHVTALCVPGKTIAMQACQLQEKHFAGASCKIGLSGNVTVCCDQKVDPKIESRPGLHSKWTIGLQTVMADLQRFAVLEDEKIISVQDRARIRSARYTTESETVSFVLPLVERKEVDAKDAVETVKIAESKSTTVAAPTPVAQPKRSLFEVFGWKGTQGKGVPAAIPSVEQIQQPPVESNNTLGMGGSGAK